jgi:hypothetical protein
MHALVPWFSPLLMRPLGSAVGCKCASDSFRNAPRCCRHDWVVDRCGKEVRYVIDYFHDSALPADSSAPRQHDMSANTQVKLVSQHLCPLVPELHAHSAPLASIHRVVVKSVHAMGHILGVNKAATRRIAPPS